MVRGTLRGVAGGALGLIALQVLTTSHGAGAAGGALAWLNSVADRALDPAVPAIPDLRTGATTPAGGARPDFSKPYLPPDATIPRPDQLPVPGHPVPN